MDAGFSEDQTALRDNVRAVLSAQCPPSVVREALTDPQRWEPLWKTAVDLGWTGLARLDDGDGLGAIELIIVCEELGAAAAPIPYLSSVGLAAGALHGVPGFAPEVQSLVDGAVGVLVTDPDVVPDASRAELFVVLSGDQLSVVSSSAATVVAAESLDPTRPLGSVQIPASAQVAVDARAVLALPLAAAAADLVGLAARILEVAVAHVRTRKQFGQPIGAFQAVKHKLADCYVSLERARSLTYAAAMASADPESITEARWRASAMAKAAASDCAMLAARTGVQVHGAIAQTWEHDMHLYVRRAWQAAAHLGDSRSLYRAVAMSRAS